MTKSPPPRILVIGGGFTGAAFALHLLRHNPDLSAQIDIIEPRHLLGAGLAYSSADPTHRINVAAARMALYAEDPTHFDTWYRATSDAATDPEALVADGRAYPQRGVFGRYVDAELRAAARRHRSATLSHRRARAIGAALVDGEYRVTLESGDNIAGDLLVLAPGHPPPAPPNWIGADLRAQPGYVGNPWLPGALEAIPRDGSVLIVGTGLTMADVVASLRAQGHVGPITAVSRRGLTPRPRTLLPVEAFGDFEAAPTQTATQLLRRVRAAIRDAAAQGRPWECVVDALRQQATTLWQSLAVDARRRMLRHARAYWDVHRYQIAPQLHDVLEREHQAGSLQVLAARLQSVEHFQGMFQVSLRTRDQVIDVRNFAAIVNCTGPDHRSVVDGNPILASLAHAGLLQPDLFGLGILVDLQSRVIDRDGRSNDTLLVSGPLARGTFGELMGLPQVSTQPERLAGHVADLLRSWSTAPGARVA